MLDVQLNLSSYPNFRSIYLVIL